MSTTTINFTLTDDAAAPLDADSTPVLRDAAAAFGVKRNDTGAVVVASGTAMVRDSAGVYHYTFTDPAADLVYTYSVEYVVDGETERLQETQAGTASTAWYYADEQAVSDLIGAVTLQTISNEPGSSSATAVDSARVLRAGLWADQLMDGRLATLGYVTPLANMSAGTVLLMADASAKLVAWKLNEMRMLTTLSTGKNMSQIDKVMEAHRQAAESTLNKIAYRAISITADRLYARPPYAKVYVPTVADQLATATARAIQRV